ncbi:hypothetical protein N0V88_002210 [Collariella sp. IMI 366227]|nr:hypothetical protein N0V88_002210 [Collariella sp. IMI 366227]
MSSRGTVVESTISTGGQTRSSGGVLHMGGGNFFDSSKITPGQVFLVETMSSLSLLAQLGACLLRNDRNYARALGSMLVALMYRFAPPSHAERVRPKMEHMVAPHAGNRAAV